MPKGRHGKLVAHSAKVFILKQVLYCDSLQFVAQRGVLACLD
jgi:hypothetical protein